MFFHGTNLVGADPGDADRAAILFEKLDSVGGAVVVDLDDRATVTDAQIAIQYLTPGGKVDDEFTGFV